jgi:hypothetical protein
MALLFNGPLELYQIRAISTNPRVGGRFRPLTLIKTWSSSEL